MTGRIPSFGRPGRPPRAPSQRGFSLIEVMMSLVLVAIGAALALPSYRDMVEKRQVTNGAEQFTAFVNTAQGVAMKTNEIVTVSYTLDDGAWCAGAVAGTTACDCTVTNPADAAYCELGGQAARVDQNQASSDNLVHSMTGDGAYSFDPIRGLFSDLDDSLSVELRSQSGDFRLRLMVNNTGRVTLCSTDANHAIPGYGLCPVVVQQQVAIN